MISDVCNVYHLSLLIPINYNTPFVLGNTILSGSRFTATLIAFANALKISGYPSMVFFDENGKLIAPVVGYKTPQQLEIYLKMIHNNDYKKLTTADAWQKYEKSFVSTFEN